MRVALFFDGKNFYVGCKQAAPQRRIDFPKMASWLVGRAGGDHLWGAHYYTSVDASEGSESEGRRSLGRFLDMLELQPGFFVKRFASKIRTFRCQSCQAANRFTQEKEVDTTMVADMLRLAAVDAYDILVLISGDADHSPAVEGIRSIGKQAFVATWGQAGLSSRLRRVAFDHIDLVDGLEQFSSRDERHSTPPLDVVERLNPDTEALILAAAEGAGGGSIPGWKVPEARPGDVREEPEGLSSDASFLNELRRAELKFADGYVGVNYFLTRWEADDLERSPDARRRILDRLVKTGQVEVYASVDGNKAIRASE